MARLIGMLAFLKAGVNHFDLRRTMRELTRLNFKDKTCLEIGGPSDFFGRNGVLPVYTVARAVDNCNFSTQTVWEGRVREGSTFNYDQKKFGHQFVAEATDLKYVENNSYDCILSSHVLEHVANPIGALLEWKRVLKEGGLLLLVMPHKQGTFDHRRPVTELSHMVLDYASGMDERDLTHLAEVLQLHDISMDPGAGTFADFAERSFHNLDNRCLHHHVFVTESAIRLLDYVGLRVLFVATYIPYHIITLSQKLVHISEDNQVRAHEANVSLLDSNASWRKHSFLTLDKRPLLTYHS